MSCIFCKISDGQTPCMKVYEDEWTIAFMDIAKDVDGHILVIPKKHVENILDCDTDTLNRVVNTVKVVSNYLVNKCGYDSVNILNASGESAGQSVSHFHIHIIPRKKDDGINAWPNLPGSKREIGEIFEEISSNKQEAR